MAWLDFLTVTLDQYCQNRPTIYLFDFADYDQGTDPLCSAKSILGEEIQEFCKQLADLEGFVVLKVMESTPDRSLHNDARVIADFIRKSCPHIHLIILSIQHPSFFAPGLICLSALSEAETNTYIDSHDLGGYVSAEEVESKCVYNYTGGAPAAIDLFLKQRQHVDLIEIQLGGLRTGNPSLFYPHELKKAISFLEEEDPDALELLLVLSVFPMGESVHSVRYIQPKKLLKGKSAVVLEDMGLVYSIELRSDNIGKFEPNKIVTVHRLVREYIFDIYFKKRSVSSKYEYIQAAVVLYFGDWLKEKRDLKGNFFNDKARLDMVMTGNARFFIIDLLSHAKGMRESEGDTGVLDKVLKLVIFYIGALNNSSNYRYIVDVVRDIWGVLNELPGSSVIQEIKYFYSMALRMREFYSDALYVTEDVGVAYSEEFSCRLKTEMAYNHLALGDLKRAKYLADEVRLGDYKADSLMHAKFICLRISIAKDKRVKLERLAKESRGRGVVRLANHIKAYLLQAITDLSQRRSMFKSAAEEALLDGDALNYVRNTIEYCDAALSEGRRLEKGDLSHLEDAYRFACNQRYIKSFRRVSDLLWKDTNNKKDLEKMLELFCRSSQLFRVLKIEGEEEKYLRDLFSALNLTSSVRQDSRLMYALMRALELNVMSFESLSNSMLTLNGEVVFIPSL